MPWEPVLRGNKFQIRLEHLEATDFLERRCPQCALVTRLATWQLHALFPANTKLTDAERYMRCRRCGHKGAQPWSIWRAYPPVRVVETPSLIEEKRRQRRREEAQKDPE